MLIAYPNHYHRRTAQYFMLKPVPLAFLSGLLMGLFGALLWMEDDATVHDTNNHHHRRHETQPTQTLVHAKQKQLQQQQQHSVIKHIDDIKQIQTSHGTMKQQLVEPFTLHPQLAGISIATLREEERIEPHLHKTMFEFFYVLEGILLIHDNNDTNHKNDMWKECKVGCFYQGVPGANQEFKVKQGYGPVRMMVYQLTT